MTRARLLDLFCGAGGASMGYHRAGFEVIGVDIAPQPRYPFEFHQADALTFPLDGFAAIHASPTCQRRARVTAWRGSREDHPDTLTPTLIRLADVSVPWVIENVPEAADVMRPDYLLCGTQFGLNVRRHRIFQRGNWTAYELLPPCTCHRNPRLLPFMHKGERAFADAMGCTWMSNVEARQAIPPAYTLHIGAQLLAHINSQPVVTGLGLTAAGATRASAPAAHIGAEMYLAAKAALQERTEEETPWSTSRDVTGCA